MWELTSCPSYHLDNYKRVNTYCLPASLRPTLLQRYVSLIHANQRPSDRVTQDNASRYKSSVLFDGMKLTTTSREYN